MVDISMGRLSAVLRAARLFPALAVASGVIAALSLGGCGSSLSDLTTASVTNYEAANLFAPAGYSISQNSDGSLHVTAAGSPSTPADRLNKIAMAAAADYGDQQHQKTFTATPPQTTFKCGKTKTTDKGKVIDIKPIDLRVVSIDVTYGRDGIAPAARNSKETAAQLKSELASETVPPDVQAAATQEVAQQCGRS
ncbi:hypothetical protein [Hyphomicrobium sp. MC1]|uniref:hypothetical protein n=1 Tax=Hyphomicrobium sp. (strain MC1) TaxID=717785 RepID=UPI000213EF76|nr:hypothetical protein [Hyphomicrobium sp. MC1]CCB64828.1 conserved exported protein of unknown function [Hyphomicrobium sp. MC1]